MDETYERFDWEKYILKNNDLQIATILSKEDAWKHWINNGKKEKRAFYFKTNDFLYVENVHLIILLLINHYINNLLNINTTEEKKKEFDWVCYLYNNPDLFLNGIQTEELAKKHWLKYGESEKRPFSIEEDSMIRHEFLNFRWERYIRLNQDLKDIQSETNAWKHWLCYGLKEERPTYLINNSKVHNGRLGNLFFINMVGHLFAIKYNLKFNYKYYQKFKKLGIDFFIGTNTYSENITLTDDNFYDLICEREYKRKNVIFTNEMWCQSRSFCYVLKYYFSRAKIKINIIKKNIFKERYENNKDLFIHLRFGDVESKTNSFYESYDNLISSLTFTNGFLSSDDINHPICQTLIKKHNLQIIDYDEIKTIMFAITCNNIILSGGTFSWLIGFLAFFSKKIYYPKIRNRWFGDIFIFPDL